MSMRNCILALSASLSLAAAAPPPLFQPASGGLAKVAAHEFSKREMLANVDWRSFVARPDSPEGVFRELNLNLLPGAQFRAERTRLVWNGAGSFTWVGRIGPDDVVLSVHDGAVHGSVQAEGRTFEIETLPGANGTRVQRIAELDPALVLRNEAENRDACGQDQAQEPEPDPDGDGVKAGADPGPGAAGPVIDVMIFWDKATADKTADMKAYLASLVEMSNLIYRNSAIPQTIRLVHSQEMNSGVAGNNNSWMRDNAEVKSLRDQHGADLVAMIVDAGMSACGVASGNFTTSKRSCALGNKTFTHELGHNMGAKHAWEQYTTHSGYAYGYINHEKSWRTVMSYSECEDGGRCTRLGYFSNPDVRYNGDPTGKSDSTDNARMLRSRSLSVSNLRPTKVPVGIGQGRIIEDAPAGFSLLGMTREGLRLGVGSPGELEIALYSLDGRKTVMARRSFAAGQHALDWPARGGGGVRFLQIRGAGGVFTRMVSPLP